MWWEGLGGSLVHALIGFPVEAGSRWVCRGFYGVPGMGLLSHGRRAALWPHPLPPSPRTMWPLGLAASEGTRHR